MCGLLRCIPRFFLLSYNVRSCLLFLETSSTHYIALHYRRDAFHGVAANLGFGPEAPSREERQVLAEVKWGIFPFDLSSDIALGTRHCTARERNFSDYLSFNANRSFQTTLEKLKEKSSIIIIEDRIRSKEAGKYKIIRQVC